MFRPRHLKRFLMGTWVAGLVLIWLAGKIWVSTFLDTFSGYFQHRRPYWAALVIWGLVGWAGNAFLTRVTPPTPSSGTEQ